MARSYKTITLFLSPLTLIVLAVGALAFKRVSDHAGAKPEKA